MNYLIAIAIAAWIVFTFQSGPVELNRDSWLFVLPASYFVVLLFLIRR